ncbi:MAG: TSCPD domain-containing protein [Fibrobacter sp.]|nr:TSCPD domain-containing protein [Fibrobacter sp.]
MFKTKGVCTAKLLGNTCGGKPTSCADQLARAVLGKEASSRSIL